MATHNYTCHDCAVREEHYFSLKDGPAKELTCDCGGTMTKVYDSENICIVSKLRSSWSDGHTIFQLPANCPDRVVTSETQYHRTLAKYGMDYQTGVPKEGRENESSAPAMHKKNRK